MTRRLVVWMHAPRYPQWHIPPRSVEAIRGALGPGWEVAQVRVPVFAAGDGTAASPPELLEAIREAEIYLGFGLSAGAVAAARRLRWVHSGAAGVGAVLAALASRAAAGAADGRPAEPRLTNSAGVYAEPLADFILASILHFARGLDLAEAARRRRMWGHGEISAATGRLFEPRGRTVGVVGYGGIGRAVGRRAAALGMRVLALRRGVAGEPAPHAAEVLRPAELPRLLAESHAVVLALPETVETRGLIGARELASMREDAVLINVSRGGIVDEPALCAALREGRLRGAALDVFAREPLPPDSPLWTTANVLITPHAAALSPLFWERETDLILTNIRRYLAGEPLVNEVDPECGY